jgi:deoxyribonuclease V
VSTWPTAADELIAEQATLAAAMPVTWRPRTTPPAVAGCFVCFPRGEHGIGSAGDPAWAAAALYRDGRLEAQAIVGGAAGAAYAPGLLALREGPVLERVVRDLIARPDVLLVNATARDHPRRAGLALHLGAVLQLPTIGVTHRLLLAHGAWPDADRGAASLFQIGDEIVGRWLRTRVGRRPLAIHPGWAIDAETSIQVVLAATAGARTPEPLRQARRLARTARAAATGSAPTT